MSVVDEETQKRIVARVLEARARRPEFLVQMRKRQQQGWEIARQCAQVLKKQFGVEKVVLFGSLLNHEEMHWRSDIDLAVWGLGKYDLFKAGAAADRVIRNSPPYDFPPIDLVDVSIAKPHILEAIEKEGVELAINR